MEDTEKNQEVQEDPSPKGLGGASRLKTAPCTEYGLLPHAVDWANPINTPETFAALVAEHKAWRAYYERREAGDKAIGELVAAMRAGYEVALLMVQVQDTPVTQRGEVTP